MTQLKLRPPERRGFLISNQLMGKRIRRNYLKMRIKSRYRRSWSQVQPLRPIRGLGADFPEPAGFDFSKGRVLSKHEREEVVLQGDADGFSGVGARRLRRCESSGDFTTELIILSRMVWNAPCSEGEFQFRCQRSKSNPTAAASSEEMVWRQLSANL